MKPIAEIIWSSNLTQKEIARRAEITGSSISKYLSGKRKPKPRTYAAVARACGYSVDKERGGDKNE